MLGLEPHVEGGYFRETYRSPAILETGRGPRSASTLILFLVTAGSISHLHRVMSDELWIYQSGLPLELVMLEPDGSLVTRILADPAEPVGEDLGAPLVPQVLVPAGSWQGARLAGGVHLPAERAWSLIACLVTPGFEYEDFIMGRRDKLLAAYPQHAEFIRTFTA